MKVLFLGTPEFAVPSLKALMASPDHEVVGVVTQPDRAVKRGKTEISPVKAVAEAAGIQVFQPARIRNDVGTVRSFGADIGITAAYGQILDRAVLDSFPHGVINVHASLLPKYRGASPIQAAIINNESETGVTIMRTELGVDTGDILGMSATAIDKNETGGELTERLSHMGAELLIDVLSRFDSITPVKQDDSRATHCSMIKKEELFIDFTADSVAVANKIRALAPLPGARTVICGEVYKIYAAQPVAGDGVPGTITECSDRLVIACGSGAISVTQIQAPGKNRLQAADFLRGKKFPIGECCGIQTDR